MAVCYVPGYDGAIEWKHFPRYWPFVREVHRSPAQSPETQNLDVFFDLYPNKLLSKQSSRRWYEPPTCPLWCHCDAYITNHRGWGYNPHTHSCFVDYIAKRQQIIEFVDWSHRFLVYGNCCWQLDFQEINIQFSTHRHLKQRGFWTSAIMISSERLSSNSCHVRSQRCCCRNMVFMGYKEYYRKLSSISGNACGVVSVKIRTLL